MAIMSSLWKVVRRSVSVGYLMSLTEGQGVYWREGSLEMLWSRED